MIYQEYKPISALSQYIDSYWEIKSPTGTHEHRVLPDGCTDIIINMGSDFVGGNSQILSNEKAYFVGNMTIFKDTLLQPDAHLIGIRFKPFGANLLLGFDLSGTADTINELSPKEFNFGQVLSSKSDIKAWFEGSFADKTSDRNKHLLHIIDYIKATKGNVRVPDLANKCCLSERQLQRIFKAKAGLTVQEFCKQVRFQHALSQLKTNNQNRSILDIAFNTGYYDHSHLTNDFVKYTGNTPSFYLPPNSAHNY